MRLVAEFYFVFISLLKVHTCLADVSLAVTTTNTQVTSELVSSPATTFLSSSDKTKLFPSSTRAVTTTDEDYDDSDGSGQDLAAIIGGTIGGVVGVVIVSIVIFVTIRRRGKKMSDPTSAQQSIVAVKNIRFFV